MSAQMNNIYMYGTAANYLFRQSLIYSFVWFFVFRIIQMNICRAIYKTYRDKKKDDVILHHILF
jgi:hypothetical protein